MDEQASLVRIFHAVPLLQPIDVYVNDTPRMKNIEYKEFTNYIPTSPGPETIKIYTSVGHNLVLELEVSVIPGQIMTYAVWGSFNNLKLLPIIDDINEDIMPDQTKVRFYNLDASDVALTLTSPIDSTSMGLGSGMGSSYTQINPGKYELQVRSTNTINLTLTFNPGRIYTVYILSSVSHASPNYNQFNIPQIILSVDGNTLFDKCIWYW